MGLTTKHGPAAIYGKLLVIYPPRYREQYEKPMVQTFDDMLRDQPGPFGKAVIWLRVLLDLPLSAAREHIMDGKDMTMTRNMKLLFGGIAILLLLANGASWWFGNLHSRETSRIDKVTAADIATAMQNDSFYSTYGNTALLFTGKVSSVTRNGGTMLATFRTTRPYAVTCQLPGDSQVESGETLSVAAPGGKAERRPRGVLLHSCVLS